MRAEADGAQELGRLGRDDRPRAAASSGPRRSPPRAQALFGLLRRRRSSRARRSPRSAARRARGRRPRRCSRLQARDVAGAAALGGQPAARASAPRAGWRRARRGRGPSGRRRWRRRRRPARRSSSSSQVGDQRLVLRPQDLAHLLDHRGASRRRRPPGPRAAARSASPVTRPLPQPASSTVSSPRSVEPVEDRLRPLLVRDRDALVARRVPVAGRVDAAIRAPSSPGRVGRRRTARRRRSPPRSPA